MTSRLRPFFSFYGGKWRIARHYPTPKYDIIIEPFAGFQKPVKITVGKFGHCVLY
jgi:hypothetical protein